MVESGRFIPQFKSPTEELFAKNVVQLYIRRLTVPVLEVRLTGSIVDNKPPLVRRDLDLLLVLDTVGGRFGNDMTVQGGFQIHLIFTPRNLLTEDGLIKDLYEKSVPFDTNVG